MPAAASADLTALAADFAAITETSLDRAAEHVVRTTAERVQQISMQKAPIKTGTLRASIGIRYESALIAIIGPSVDYGVYQEFGTGSRGEFPGTSYKIRPKTPGGLLVFEIEGRKIFTKEVTHPGVRAQPFMRPAVEEALGPMTAELARRGSLLIVKGPRSAL